jgi:surface polysaccharide O-acyltransferase-like enzyme
MLGWDLWRFVGCLLIFIGHNGLAFQLSKHYDAAAMASHSFFGVLTSPMDACQLLIFTCVPVFIFISGYFSLSKPINPGKDWNKAKAGFWKYILHYWKWLTLSAVFLIIMAISGGVNSVAAMFMKETMTWDSFVIGLIKNYVNMDLLDYGATTMVALNWFFVVMAWLMLLTPIFQYFVQSKHVKMVRTLTLVLLTFSCIIPTVRYVFSYLLTLNGNAVFEFFANVNPLFSNEEIGFNIVNFAIPMYLFGGLFAIDEKLKEKIKNLPWFTAMIIVVVLFAAQVGVQYASNIIPATGYVSSLSYYPLIGWFPMTTGWVILAYKWNFSISENSKLGKFIINWAPDTLGVMTLGWFLGPYILSTVCLPIFDSMIINLWNPSYPIVFTTVLNAFYVLYFVIIFVLVHLLKKVPVVRRAFMFSGEKIREKSS